MRFLLSDQRTIRARLDSFWLLPRRVQGQAPFVVFRLPLARYFP